MIFSSCLADDLGLLFRVNHYLGTYDSEWDAASVYGKTFFVR
jgi:hypothetical protein